MVVRAITISSILFQWICVSVCVRLSVCLTLARDHNVACGRTTASAFWKDKGEKNERSPLEKKGC